MIGGPAVDGAHVVEKPNEAGFDVHLDLGELRRGSAWARWQYLCLAELCNDCGNCTTFCPERGDPFLVKPRLSLSEDVWSEEAGSAYLITGNGQLLVEASEGAPDVELVRALLTTGEGLPLRAGDL